MDNPVDNPFDLGFVNYVQHPENSDYIVYRFSDQARAVDFERTLNERSIWFEKDEEEKRGKIIYLFAVHKTDFKHTQPINFDVEGKHKKPTIPFKGLRYGLLLFTLTCVLLASISYCKSMNHLKQVNKTYTRVNK